MSSGFFDIEVKPSYPEKHKDYYKGLINGTKEFKYNEFKIKTSPDPMTEDQRLEYIYLFWLESMAREVLKFNADKAKWFEEDPQLEKYEDRKGYVEEEQTITFGQLIPESQKNAKIISANKHIFNESNLIINNGFLNERNRYTHHIVIYYEIQNNIVCYIGSIYYYIFKLTATPDGRSSLYEHRAILNYRYDEGLK